MNFGRLLLFQLILEVESRFYLEQNRWVKPADMPVWNLVAACWQNGCLGLGQQHWQAVLSRSDRTGELGREVEATGLRWPCARAKLDYAQRPQHLAWCHRWPAMAPGGEGTTARRRLRGAAAKAARGGAATGGGGSSLARCEELGHGVPAMVAELHRRAGRSGQAAEPSVRPGRARTVVTPTQ
jgi:hypothetical protein